MGILPGLGCAGLSRGRAKATYCGAKSASTSVSSITHTGASIGTAAPDRYIVLVMGHRNIGGSSNFVDTVTVGGVATTAIAARQYGNAADDPMIEIWITTSPVATGTTADIAVTYQGVNDRHCVGVYSVTGIPRYNAYSTTNGFDGGAGSITLTANKREGGCTIIGSIYSSGSGSQAVTFTGAEIVEDAQVQIAATTANMAFASASDTTGASISATITSASRANFDVAALVNFYPG